MAVISSKQKLRKLKAEIGQIKSGNTGMLKPEIRWRRLEARGQMVLRRLRFRVNGLRAQQVVQNLGLHSLHFQAVTADSSLEFPRAGGLA